MKKVNRCNETKYYSKKEWESITYNYVTEDDNTPSSCTIRLGDVDPMTGEKIADMTIFAGYYEQVNREVRSNLDQIRIEKNKKEREETKKMEAILADQFERDHGCRPNKDQLKLELEKVEGKPYILRSTDTMINEEGESALESWLSYSEPFRDPFEDDLPTEFQALRSVASSLTGRLQDVYRAMISRYDPDVQTVRFVTLAKKWNVSPAQITKDIKKIGNLVRAKAAELSEE